jgi:hypothetical protein
LYKRKKKQNENRLNKKKEGGRHNKEKKGDKERGRSDDLGLFVIQ